MFWPGRGYNFSHTETCLQKFSHRNVFTQKKKKNDVQTAPIFSTLFTNFCKNAWFWLLYETDALLRLHKLAKKHGRCQLVSKDEMNMWVGLNLHYLEETPCKFHSIWWGNYTSE